MIRPTPSPAPTASTLPLPPPPAPALAKMASNRMHVPRGAAQYERQASSRGATLESLPLSEDRGKDHALTEPFQRGHKGPSAIRYGLPVPPEPTPASSEPPQRHEDPPATPHSPPVPPEHASATTGPPLQGHKDSSTAQHRLPAPPERVASRQSSKDLSATPHRPAPGPSQQGHRDPSATSHRRFAPPEHTPAEHSPSSAPHRPTVPQERTHAMAKLLSRQESKGPSATQHRLPVPLEQTDPTLPQPAGSSHLSARSKSRTQGSERVDRGAEPEQTANGPLLDKKERKRKMGPEELVDRVKDPANPEPNLKAPSDSSSVQQPLSNHGRAHASSTLHLPEMSDSRESLGKVGSTSNSTPALDRRETHITPTFVSARNQPKRNNPSFLTTLD